MHPRAGFDRWYSFLPGQSLMNTIVTNQKHLIQTEITAVTQCMVFVQETASFALHHFNLEITSLVLGIIIQLLFFGWGN